MKTNAAEIKVRSGVPVPRRNKYPFAKMVVGDYFFAPSGTPRTTQSSIAAMAKRMFPKRTYTTHVETKPKAGEQSGVHCWRVE